MLRSAAGRLQEVLPRSAEPNVVKPSLTPPCLQWREETPRCACCGSAHGVERHHLYPRSDGCPDDLTVPLCHRCHGRVHGMRRLGELIKAARELAHPRGRAGKRSLREIATELAALGHVAPSGKPYGAESVRRMIHAGGRKG